MAEVTLDNVVKMYGDVVAVDHVSLTIRDGEFVSLVGPSGCGKTTTLRILLGLDRDFEGTIRPDLREVPVGIVFQEPRLLPWRTVEENVRLPLRASRQLAPLDPLFADLGLEEWRNRYPGELSLGMSRRVAVARALALEPDLLLLDEPFVSLDERTSANLRALVFEIVERRKMTAILVTHNLREALELGDRMILLTPRPAGLLASIPLPMPRNMRSSAWVEKGRRDLAARFSSVAD